MRNCDKTHLLIEKFIVVVFLFVSLLCAENLASGIASDDSLSQLDLVDVDLRLYRNEDQVCGPVAVCAALTVVGAPQPYADVRASIPVTDQGSSLEDCKKYLETHCSRVMQVKATHEYIQRFLAENEDSAAIIHENQNHWACISGDKNYNVRVFRYPGWELWKHTTNEGEFVYALLISNHSGDVQLPKQYDYLTLSLLVSLALLAVVNFRFLMQKTGS
ncbi:hypothetical protein Pan241w_08140 [Gimesia alba]|uniref:Peptidase C39-like domain-containing protein n=1 Tax=Gimesia alba TaxID=2527973 RepID=A0A517RA51_9PLAN|nr:hypothetical protein [Gimesia alba]QDT40755.1 hypothetical protein Pan241w_08140 [Gimesia alba]